MKLAIFGLSLAACETRARAHRTEPPGVLTDAPEVTEARRDSESFALCALRSAPPEDLVLGEGRSRGSVLWNGTHFGVVWTEARDGQDSVMFVRVGEDGGRMDSPVRVSEPGSRAHGGSLAWNGASWSVVYVGGMDPLGDLYQARVDSRGIPVGRAWRMTGGAREDSAPSLVGSGPGYGLGWVSRELNGRFSLYAQGLRTWDSRELPPTRAFNTSVALSDPRLVWTGHAWALTVLSSRREALGIDLARMEPDGRLRSSMKRVTPGILGGQELQSRYAVAWDGETLTFAWSEQRDGRTEIRALRTDLRGEVQGSEFVLSVSEGSTRSPALEPVGEGVLVAAYELDREGVSRVRVRALNAHGVQPGYVELQGTDGRAGAPAMAWTGSSLGVVSTTPRGLSFHRVVFGPCLE